MPHFLLQNIQEIPVKKKMYICECFVNLCIFIYLYLKFKEEIVSEIVSNRP